MERLFNALPYRIQKITGVKTDTFKKKLDEWLREIPDTPKIDDYGATPDRKRVADYICFFFYESLLIYHCFEVLKYYSWNPVPFYSMGRKRFSHLKINEKSCNTALVKIIFLFDYVKSPSHVNKVSPFAHNMPLVLYLYCAWMTLLGYVSVSLHIFQLLYTAMYFFIT